MSESVRIQAEKKAAAATAAAAASAESAESPKETNVTDYRPSPDYFLTYQSLTSDGNANNKQVITLDVNIFNFLTIGFLDRSELYEKWARIRNFFKSQPLDLIRSYYGDTFAFYFSWVGSLIFMLFIPTIAGFAFFLYGIIKRLLNSLL